MRELRGWRLGSNEGTIFACGGEYNEVDDYVGCFIVTQPVVSVKPEKDHLVAKIDSGDEFLLQYKFMSVAHANDVQDVMHQLGCGSIPEDVLKEYFVPVPKDLKPGYVWLFMGGTETVFQAWHCLETGEKEAMDVGYHLGSFGHDSILLGDDDCELRFFDYGVYIEPYVWSENIKGVLILNQGEDFEVRGKSSVLCAKGSTAEVSRSLFGD